MVYIFNDTYFSKIDTEDKAYWLGFISADGGLSYPGHGRKNGYTLAINLASKDKDHLVKFQKCINRAGPILDVKVKTYAVSRLNIGSKSLIIDLIAAGVTARKSFTIKPWIGPSEIMKHYWRGVFDGDGSISKVLVKKKELTYPAWKISLNGNLEMVSGFRDFVIANGAKSKGYLGKHSNIYKISWGGVATARSVVKCLYDSSTVYLDRKNSLAKELLCC